MRNKSVSLKAAVIICSLCLALHATAQTVTDYDGNVYNNVKIGNQLWMKENLKVTHYRNGDLIPNDTSASSWSNLTTGARSYYNNDSGTYAGTYGALYNWYSVADSRNLCPVGWHVPSDDEWKQLEMKLGMTQQQADLINWRGTDQGAQLKLHDGFAALMGGYREIDGTSYVNGHSGYWWSLSENDINQSFIRVLYNSANDAFRGLTNKKVGNAVRCLKNNPDTVRNLTATPGEKQITLNWQANTESDFWKYRIYIDTAINPTIIKDSVIGKSNTSKIIYGLSTGVKYYFRIKAVDSIGLESDYSSNASATTITTPIIVTDVDSNIYNTVKIGNQLWMKENLKTTKFSNGSPIPLVADNTTWGNLTNPGYCWYNNDASTYKNTYGALYNWYVVDSACNGGKNVCPTAWHVPTDTDWKSLEIYLGMTQAQADEAGWSRGSDQGNQLKEVGNSNWLSPSAGNNKSGFSAFPTGFRTGDVNGLFITSGTDVFWWSSSSYGSIDAWSRCLDYSYPTIYRNYVFKNNGFSIRCLKYNPDTVRNLTATSGNQQITLKWRKNTEADFAKYYIYGGTTANPTTKIDSTTSINDTTKTITGLTNGTTYYYRVTAVDDAGLESGYSNEVNAIPVGLIAYYPFNGNANDESGNVNNGVVNGATLTNDRFGNANSSYYFDGINDFINCGNSSVLNLNKMTISAWVKSSNWASQENSPMIISKGINQNYCLWKTNNSEYNNKLGFRINFADNTIYSNETVQDNIWYHIIATYNGNEMKLYVNGILACSPLLYSEVMNTNNVPLIIGGGNVPTVNLINSVIDDIRLYNRAISTSEIDSLYHLGGWPAPDTVRNLTATPGDKQITLNWQANTESNFWKYRIYMDTAINPTTQVDSVIGKSNTSKTIYGLNTGVKYYFRITAVDSAGLESAYSLNDSATTVTTAITVNDKDGNIYNTVKIGNQLWMKENLKTTKYNDGVSINNVTVNTAWITSEAAYCWYNNDAATYKATYGALYNWFAVDPANNGGKNVCPTGWYVPSDVEWTNLITFIANDGHSGSEGTALKAASGWNSGNGTDNYNFTALPGGYRYVNDGTFSSIGDILILWGSTTNGASEALSLSLYGGYDIAYHFSYNKQSGFSVRCLKNTPDTVRNLTATPGNQQIILKWNKNTESDFVKYYIYGGTSANPTTKIDSTLGISDTSITITGLINGTTYYYRVTAIDNAGLESGYSNEVSVTPKILVESITISGAGTITNDGETILLTATVLPSNASDKTVTWTVVSGTDKATVNTSGYVTALRNGTAIIRATATDGSNIYGEKTISISNQVVEVENIDISGGTAISVMGGTLQLSAVITPSDADNPIVNWSSSDTTIATVSTSGLVTAKTDGTVTITVAAVDGSGVNKQVVVNISNQPPAVPVLSSPANLSTGVTPRPILKWLASSGATSYHLQVSVASNFATTVFDDTTLTTNYGQTGMLQANRIFYWRVRAKNAYGWTTYSAVWSLQTYPAPACTSVSILSSFTSPGSRVNGLTWDGHNIWMIDNLQTLYKLDTAGNVKFSKNFSSITSDQRGLAWDGTGLWIAEAIYINTNLAHIKIDTLGNIIDTLAVSHYWHDGFEWDGKYLWLGNYNSSLIYKHTKEGVTILNFATGSIFGHPTGISYDGNNLWISGSGEGFSDEGEIFKYTTSGTSLAEYDFSGLGIAQNWGYYSLAWDGKSLWYASDEEMTIYRMSVPYYSAVPVVPVLSSPANSAVHIPASTILSWNSATNAEYYHVQVSTNSTFTNIIYENTSLVTTSVQIGSLTKGTTFYWRVRATNPLGASAYATYRSFTTIYDAPTTQSSNIIVTDCQSSQITLGWTKGNGQNCAVFIKQANSGTTSPSDNTSYTANTIYSSGTQIGTSGWYCIYNGTSTAVTVTGLAEATEYRFMVFEYNNGTGYEAYNQSSGFGNPVTKSSHYSAPTTQASLILFEATTANQTDISWTRGSGQQCAAFMYMGTTGSVNPIKDTLYTQGTVFGQGKQIGTGWYCIYNGTGNKVTVTGLLPNIGYRVKVFEYNGITGNIEYNNNTATGNPANITTPVSLINSIIITSAVDTIKTGMNTLQLSADILPVDATNKILNWSILSDDADTASINSTTGLLTAIRDGKVTVRATSTDGSGVYGEKNIVIDRYINYQPSAPGSLSAIPGNKLVILQWKKSPETDVVKYLIYGGTLPNPVIKIDSTTNINDTTKTISGLTNGQTYYFRLTAMDNAGLLSGFSDDVSCKPHSEPICISTAGNDANNGTAGAPLRYIQTALSRAVTGDTIKVMAGTYDEVLTTQVQVILLGGYTSSFMDSERDIFENKTFIEGINTKMLTDQHASTINGFIFHGNSNVSDVQVTLYNGSVFTQNIIIGLYSVTGTEVNGGATVINNTLYSCYWGISISSGTGTPVIRNNIVKGGNYGINTYSYTSAVRSYNNVYSDLQDYSGFDQNPGTGDISQDPKFKDAANIDFRLYENSPGVDAGNPADPAESEPSPYNNRIDMGAYGGTKHSPYFPAVPGEPVLAYPLNGAEHQLCSITFKWNKIPDIGTYRLQISSNTSFSSGILINDSTLVDTFRLVTNLDFNTTYYWRVNAKVTLGTSPYSSVFSFSTTNGSIHVSTSGNDANNGTAGAPLRYIQTALSRAVNGDTIKVMAGTYDEVLTTQVKVILLGGYTTSFIENERYIFANKTIIGGVNVRMLTDQHASTVDGFIFNGNISVDDAQVILYNGSVFTHNIVKGLYSAWATGIDIYGGATVINNTLYSCYYGISYSSGTGTPVIRNNIIEGSSYGMNNYAYNSSVRTYNNVHAITQDYTGSDQNPGTGDISQVPGFKDATNGDFRLLESSFCVDAGNPSDAAGNEPAPYNSRIDMGAYGGTKYSPYLLQNPSAPTNLILSPGNQQITLKWNNSAETDVVKYYIYGGTSANPTTKTDSTNSRSDTTKIITGLTAGTTYYYRIKAVDIAGLESEYSNEVSESPLDANPGSIAPLTTDICTRQGTGTLTLINNTYPVSRWERMLNSGAWENINNTLATYSEIPAQPGTWQYRAVTFNGASEYVSSAATVVVYSSTENGTVDGSKSICLGGSTGNMTLSGYTGTISGWQRKLDNNSWKDIITTNPIYSEIPSQVGIWYYRAVLSGGPCAVSYSAEAIITVSSIPGSSTVSNHSACANEPLYLKATGTNIKWYSDAGLTALVYSGDSLVVSAGAGTYDYYTTQSTAGCESQGSKATLTVKGLAAITSVTKTDATSCGADDGSITINATGTGTLGYSIDGGNTFTSGSSFNSLKSGNSYFVAVRNGNGCVLQDDTMNISSPDAPKPPILSETSVSYCKGNTLRELCASLQSGQTGSIYWYNEASCITPVYIGSCYLPEDTVGFRTYYVRVKNNACFSNPVSADVMISAIPSAPLASDMKTCVGTDTAIAATASSPVTWYTNTSLTDSITTGPSLPLKDYPSGSHTLYIIQTKNNCRSLKKQVNAVINSLPSGSITGDDGFCAGSSALDTLHVTGKAPLTWTYKTGSSTFNVNLDSIRSKVVSAAGNIQITRIVDGNGCIINNPVSKYISEFPLPKASAGQDKIIFTDESTALNGSATGGTGSYTYLWLPSSKISGSNNVKDVTTTTLASTQTYILNVRDDNSCSATDTMKVLVTDKLTLSISKNPICMGDTINIIAALKDGTSFQWSSVPASSVPSLATITVSPSSSTWYKVIADNGIMKQSDSVRIVVNVLPNATITGSSKVCENAAGNLYSVTNQAGCSYNWNVTGEETVSGLNTSQITVNWGTSGTGAINLTVINSTKCSKFSTLNVTINENPTITFSLDSIDVKKDQLTAPNFSSTGDNLSYQLGPEGLNGTISTNYLSFIPPSSGSYCLTATDANNCKATDCIDIRVHCSDCQEQQTVTDFSEYLTHGCEFGYYYNDNANCSWIMTESGASNIFIRFDTLDIVSGDYIQVYDYFENRLLGTFDNLTMPVGIIETGPAMKVVLKSNNNTTGKGFVASIGSDITPMPEAWTGINSKTLPTGQLVVYPNPTNRVLNIEFLKFGSGQIRISIYDLTGKLVFDRQTITNNGKINAKLDLNMLNKGMYQLIVNDSKSTLSRKVVIY